MNLKIKLIVLGTLLIVFSACQDKENKKFNDLKSAKKANSKSFFLVGSWLDISESSIHFTINEDGTVHSNNMKTYLYRKWNLKGDSITFTIESVGNHLSFIGKETFYIYKLNDKKMVLESNKGIVYNYTRKLDQSQKLWRMIF